MDCARALGSVVDGTDGLWHAPGIPAEDLRGGNRVPLQLSRPHTYCPSPFDDSPYGRSPLSSHSSHYPHYPHYPCYPHSTDSSLAQVVPIGGPCIQSSVPPEGMPVVHPREEETAEILLRSKATLGPCFLAASGALAQAQQPLELLAARQLVPGRLRWGLGCGAGASAAC